MNVAFEALFSSVLLCLREETKRTDFIAAEARATGAIASRLRHRRLQ